ncbi:MAG TPA: type II toxin-antitoxin system prevent-host-death family antitoxin [Fimbriimonas sp.]|nr:type II toxin-antitoxin system prevent-host-death family antitoxin [Fimbriimonas sp.]
MSYSEARATLARAMERVCKDHEPLIITRQGKPSAVLISLEDYESLDETAYLRRSPVNARRLTKSMKELAAGTGISHSLEDFAP